MKTFTAQIVFMAVLLALPVFVQAQVFEGDLTLSTQAEVNAFNYTEVSGSLTIGNPEEGAPSTDITSLNSLSTLTKVEASLIIVNNDQLQTLQGLENLTTIGESLDIADNPELTSLQGLKNLSSVVSISINNNAQLQTLQGLENISSLGGLSISGNDQLQNLQGLENLTTIEGNLDIADNPALTSLQGLKNLSSVVSISINNNDQLQNLQGLNNLASVTVFDISNNAQLQNLQGLDSFASAIEFYISNNAQLQNLQGLDNFTTIDYKPSYCGEGHCGFFYITDNPRLTSLQGLENLTDVAGDFSIADNQVLTSLQGLNNLNSVNWLQISRNNQLQNLQGLENLTGGGLIIEGNSALTSLQGLENISSLGALWILENDQLQNLQGLENLTIISDLTIEGNPGLTSLQGLNNLNSVYWLQISRNNQLQNLQGLENLKSLEHIRILNNPNLNDCCAIAELLFKVTGSVVIEGNDSNCNSAEAIQESCPPVITGFTLVNATTDQDISDLDPYKVPEVIDILETGNQLNIRANTSPETVGSVVFALDGVIINKENVFPYALAGDLPPGDYRSWTPTLGRHTLTATPYDEKNGKGQAGEPLTLEFVVIDQPLAVISFTLVTTDDDQDQYELKDGSTISLQQFDPAKLNIRANTYPEEVGSVVFDLNAVKNFQTENVFPYALAGDIPPGDYKDYTLEPGTYQLTATPYSMPRGRGEAGMPLSITFEVVEDAVAVARTMSAPSPKAKAVEDVTVAQNITQVMVYPNPSEGLLHIKLPDAAQPVALYLYNAQGHQVMETTGSEAGSLILDVSHLASGMYVLKVASGQNTAMHRILLK